MVQSITEYVSYFEAGEDMTDEEYGLYMRAIHKFAYLDIEPDYSALPPLVKAALRTVIASVRKNKEDRENGSKGGAKAGNTNAKKQPAQENKNNPPCFSENNPPCFLETTNEKEKEKENVKGKEKENENEKERENSLSPESESEKMALINPNAEPDYARPIFAILKQADLPCCNKNFVSFLNRDWMNAKRILHSAELRGLHSDEVIAALENYVKVLENPCTWHGWKSRKSFDSFVSWERFKDFLPDRFCIDNFLEHTASPPKQARAGVGVDRVMQMIDEVGA